ncbi:MAG: cation:proton antiporter [Solirubrobacterales bacterium]|nr:cation:proton antiporter [Solirubrobacterales bacterium]
MPFFFIVSGMQLDLPALFRTSDDVAKMAVFFVLFLVVRGVPVPLLYRKVMPRRDRLAPALMSTTQLPLVLAITALATSEGHMWPSTAAALVGGALLSTLVFPVLGLRLRGDLETRAPAVAA